jgi:hypothetical protein
MQLTPNEFEVVRAALRACVMNFNDMSGAAMKLGKYKEAANMANFAYWCRLIEEKMQMESSKVGLLLGVDVPKH